jgi:hypothetical protein
MSIQILIWFAIMENNDIMSIINEMEGFDVNETNCRLYVPILS